MLESLVMFMFLHFNKPIYCDTVDNWQKSAIIAQETTIKDTKEDDYVIATN